MYIDARTPVKSERTAPTMIVMMSHGERVCWPARDVAGTTDGVYAYVSDMVALGWSAIRDGDSIVLHPVEAGELATPRRN